MKSPRPTARLTALSSCAMALASAAWAAPARAAAPPLSVAIVVGSNQSPSASLENLRYGDDDAVQNARTLQMLGAQTTLLVSPDAETRELFPMAHPDGAATSASLRATFQRATATLAAAHAAGRHTELYFLFAGHGDMADGRPFLQLDDGRLWREDLAELLRAAGADENHVLVDACYASSFVNSRGPGGERERLPPGFSRGQQAVWPAHIGFLTARSSGGQTHEWAEYQSGVFSHELRSGLSGAADVNLDGKVTYREIAAFVHRANEAIPNRRYRPEVSTTPPGGNLDASLAVLPSGPIVLEMDLQPSGRAFVESENGIRLVDLHAAPGQPVRLRLPTDLGSLYVEQLAATDARPAGLPGSASTPADFVASTTHEYRLAPTAGTFKLSALAAETPHVRARGAGHEAFLHLFARPFDGAAVTAFQLEDGDRADLEWTRRADAVERRQLLRHRLGIGALSLSVATAVVGAGFLWSGHAFYESHKSLNNTLPPGAQGRVDQRYWTGGILLGVAGASAVTGAILLLWPQAPNLSVATLPGCEACLAYQKAF
jgi:hypothetical protein